MNRRFALMAMTAPSCLLAACGGSDTLEPAELPFARIQAFWATTDLQQTYTLRTDAEWQDAWRAHEPRITPPIVRPTVDFSTHMVVGVTRGTGPNGCHGLGIERVVDEASGLRVEYRLAVPPPAVLCTQSTVALTDFVIVQRSGKPTTFLQVGA